MIGKLHKLSTFSEIKKWFELNKEILPKTLQSDCKFYLDVQYSVDLYVYRVLSEIERVGVKNIKTSKVAGSSKNNLYVLYLDLQIKENWNKKLQ